jgi:predicted anti-sigma-YlaC factor YlaD
MLDCRTIEMLIDEYIDGDLNPELRGQIEDHTLQCQDCERKLYLAGQIARELQALPRLTCPPAVIRNVHQQIKSTRESWFRRIIPRFMPMWKRYALGISFGLAVMVVTLILFGTYAPLQWFHGKEPHYSEQEIALARQNILLAFGYVHLATNRTQLVIAEDILPQRVVRPLQRSLEHMHLSKEKGESS